LGTEFVVGGAEAGERLDKFLAAPSRLGSRSRVAAALERGKIFLNDTEAAPSDASRRLTAGDVLRIWMDRPGSATPRRGEFVSGELHILYEDAALLVLNKPAGILSVPLERRATAVSAYDLIEDHLRSSGKRRPLVVHRIDLDTSGLVVFAKTAAAREALKEQFKRREPERVYWAVVNGYPQPAEGRWRDRLVWDRKALVQKEARGDDPRGIAAIADYRVLERFRDASLVEVRLHTGKRNQIRIQAQLRGHPLVGERRYVSGSGERRIPFPRQALHAFRLSFLHPTDGRQLAFEAPLPVDFEGLLARLRNRA
jgi:23S rRNA pseudouridine1911/1915/1917 synthase